MEVKFTDNSDEVLALLKAAAERAMERCGLQAEGYAKDLCPVDTGLLRNSITFAVAGEAPQIKTYRADKGDKKGSYSGTAPQSPEHAVYIGTNVEHASYVECGTGAKNTPGGRPGSWGYIDAEGKAHHTNGQRAQPYLKPAVANHKQTYINIIKDEMENG